MSKRKNKTTRPKSYYDLVEIRQKIDDGLYLIRRDAANDAFHDFGWETSEILDALKMLKAKHFYKTDTSKINSLWVIDVYKAHINGEHIYTHFYIDDSLNRLVINSFKRE